MYRHTRYDVEEFCEGLTKALGRKKVEIAPDYDGGSVEVKYRGAAAGWIIHGVAVKFGFSEGEGALVGDTVEIIYD